MFFYKVSISLSLIGSLLWFFTYYQNQINPAKMPLYTLTNDIKTIQFQWMSHIASSQFYTWVQAAIWVAKKENFVLFFEWVRPGSEENLEKFNQAIWVDFNPSLYENFSKLYWVTHQNNEDFLWILNDNDFNIDLDIDTIMSLYNKKIDKNSISLEETNIEVPDVSTDIIEILTEMSDKQLAINAIISNFGNQDLFAVILDDRNTHLVENINQSEYNKIIVIYGLMHFEWVFDLLQSEDENWRIERIDYARLIY